MGKLVFVLIIIFIIVAFAYVILGKSDEGGGNSFLTFFSSSSDWSWGIFSAKNASTSREEKDSKTTSNGSSNFSKEKSRVVQQPPLVSPEKKEPEKPPITPPFGFTLRELSPVYDKIAITRVDPADRYGEITRIKLEARESLGVRGIDITGWRVKSNKGTIIFIPKAISRYSPRDAFPEENIILHDKEYVYFYNSRSPMNKNVRLNKCTGYLNTLYNTSEFPEECPTLYFSEEIASLSGSCQDFIKSLDECEVPTSEKLNEYASEQACRMYLNTFNHATCYNRHSNDSDFLSPEWRVWLSGYWPLDANHDRLLLFDANGLLVNIYTY